MSTVIQYIVEEILIMVDNNLQKNIDNVDINTKNHWVKSYSPMLSKTFNPHINVDFYSSVKSIK